MLSEILRCQSHAHLFTLTDFLVSRVPRRGVRPSPAENIGDGIYLQEVQEGIQEGHVNVRRGR